MPAIVPAFTDPLHPVLALSALEQAARIQAGSLTSRELVELYLSRIERHDPAIGAFVSTFADAARKDADKADAARKNGKLSGPFHGVPTAMKDLHFVKGGFTRMGSRSWKYMWSPFDDQTTKSIRKGGFIIVGKTSTSEIGLLPIVETDIQPPTRNPWNLAHTAGGSSGGAGASVAAGLIPIAPGSDGAGSVRIPASLAGLVGLKPSRGLVPMAFARVDLHQMASMGPLARNIEDAAALLDVLAGTEGTFLKAAAQPVRPLRLGLLVDPPMGEVHPEIAARVRQAAETAKALGHEIVERPRVSVELDEFLPVYQQFVSRVPVPFESRLQPMTRWFRKQGRALSDATVKARLDKLVAHSLQLLQGVDALITPTIPVLPPQVGEFAHLPPDEMFRALSPLGAFTAAWNISGLPALTVPWGQVDGFPVGVQLVGKHGSDGQLLALGRTLQEVGAERVVTSSFPASVKA